MKSNSGVGMLAVFAGVIILFIFGVYACDKKGEEVKQAKLELVEKERAEQEAKQKAYREEVLRREEAQKLKAESEARATTQKSTSTQTASEKYWAKADNNRIIGTWRNTRSSEKYIFYESGRGVFDAGAVQVNFRWKLKEGIIVDVKFTDGGKATLFYKNGRLSEKSKTFNTTFYFEKVERY